MKVIISICMKYCSFFISLQDATLQQTEKFEKASKELANEAVRQCSGDNVSVILVEINYDENKT